jgi:hypothetical protein
VGVLSETNGEEVMLPATVVAQGSHRITRWHPLHHLRGRGKGETPSHRAWRRANHYGTHDELLRQLRVLGRSAVRPA